MGEYLEIVAESALGVIVCFVILCVIVAAVGKVMGRYKDE